MAIIKEIPTEYGVNFNYHKISEVKIINTDNDTQVRIIVSSYADEEARKQNKTPVKKECIIQNGEFALQAFYSLLKTYFPDYKDGEDELTKKEETAYALRVVEQSFTSNNYKVIEQEAEPTTEAKPEENDTINEVEK